MTYQIVIAGETLRIILDSKSVLESSQVLRDGNVLIATTAHAPKDKRALLERKGVEVLTFTGDAISPRKILSVLRKRGIISVFVEGGGSVLGSFVDEKLVDKVYAFYAPVIIGGEKAVTIRGCGADTIKKALRLDRLSVRHFGDNMLIIGYPRSS